MEIIMDDLEVYAHVDGPRGEALVAHRPDADVQATGAAYQALLDRGYYRVSESYYDSEWGRDVHVLVREEPEGMAS